MQGDVINKTHITVDMVMLADAWFWKESLVPATYFLSCSFCGKCTTDYFFQLRHLHISFFYRFPPANMSWAKVTKTLRKYQN